VALLGVIDAPGDDVLGVDANERLGVIDGFGSPADLDAARPPRRLDIVDDDGRPTGTGYITELLGGGEVPASDFDDILGGADAPANRRDVRGAVWSDGG
jgi:hypothetical protein